MQVMIGSSWENADQSWTKLEVVVLDVDASDQEMFRSQSAVQRFMILSQMAELFLLIEELRRGHNDSEVRRERLMGLRTTLAPYLA